MIWHHLALVCGAIYAALCILQMGAAECISLLGTSGPHMLVSGWASSLLVARPCCLHIPVMLSEAY